MKLLSLAETQAATRKLILVCNHQIIVSKVLCK